MAEDRYFFFKMENQKKRENKQTNKQNQGHQQVWKPTRANSMWFLRLENNSLWSDAFRYRSTRTVVPPSRCTGLAVLIYWNIRGSPAFWNQGGNSLTPSGLCSQWQRHLCRSLNHLWGPLSFPFLEGQDMAAARHLYCSPTKGSEIWLSSFILSQICPPNSPSWVYFCWCNPISTSVFCQHLNWSMSHIIISLSNDYSATPLLLSPENVFSFLLFQHGYTESFTSIQVLVSFCSPVLYFLYWHFILNWGKTTSCLRCCD